jgi:hypothetical protein
MTETLTRHSALRTDAYPPDADYERRLYLCQDGCQALTWSQLRAHPVPHDLIEPASLSPRQPVPGTQRAA